MSDDQRLELAYDIASVYSELANVEAVAVAGSQLSGDFDETSDIDLYVYLRDDLTINMRAVIAQERSSQIEVGNAFWEPGDEWVEDETNIDVDVMFRRKQWIEDQLTQVLDLYNASLGYSTSIWYNLRQSKILFDRHGWLHGLKERAMQPYPDALQRAIIAKNFPILRNRISSYYAQLEKAIKRGDLVSINHRTTALVASYFDVLFALNRQPHPGEKRIIVQAELLCQKRPVDMRSQVESLFKYMGEPSDALLITAKSLLDGLEYLVRAERLYPVED